MKFGAIAFGGKLGGYKIANQSATTLPQDLASAVNELFDGEGKILGANYNPIWYVGSQIVNGTNHMLICSQQRATVDSNKRIVAVVINISPENKASIVEIIDDADLIEGTSSDSNVRAHFNKALEGLLGVKYTPVLYLGSQVVKGINHFAICEARAISNSAEPYPAIVGFNVFQNQSTLFSIEPLS